MAKSTGSGQNTATPNLDPSHELPPAQGVKAQAQDLAQGVKNQAQDLAQGAKDQVKDAAQGAKEQVKSLATDAKEEVKGMANEARDHVQELVGQQKDQAAERLGSLAEALREAARKLNEGDKAGDFGQYADRAAGQVERLSNYLRDNDLRGFIRDTENLARRRPEVFLGGTLIAGLMLARFLKASSSSQGSRSGYDGGALTGYPQSAGRRPSYQGQSSTRASSYTSTPQRSNDLGGANVGTAPGATPSTPPMGA